MLYSLQDLWALNEYNRTNEMEYFEKNGNSQRKNRALFADEMLALGAIVCYDQFAVLLDVYNKCGTQGK